MDNERRRCGTLPRCCANLNSRFRETIRAGVRIGSLQISRWSDEDLLSCFPVKGINILGANVAKQQRRIVRSEG
jgi:hypothetical protein